MEPPDYFVGTIFPKEFAPHLGEFIVYFSAMETEMNHLIWHIAGLSEQSGRAVTAAIPYYVPRATLLERLVETNVTLEADKKKLIKLAHEFVRIADYRNRVIHDEQVWYSPIHKTVGIFRAETAFKPQGPTEVSIEWLNWYSGLSIAVRFRMQQYRLQNSNWLLDEHFPWHDKPLPVPQKTTQVQPKQGKRKAPPQSSQG
ncbi:MAG TPA: hypothetical protein VF194_01465 [Ferrovibrio sp.]|uniref:hypothetical protein n=1 Tax=Ferrovibrio sp. TaxID=1917215 RepID=UPI002ED003E0